MEEAELQKGCGLNMASRWQPVRGSLEVMKQPPLTDQRRWYMMVILALGRQRQDHECLASLSYVEKLRKRSQTDRQFRFSLLLATVNLWACRLFRNVFSPDILITYWKKKTGLYICGFLFLFFETKYQLLPRLASNLRCWDSRYTLPHLAPQNKNKTQNPAVSMKKLWAFFVINTTNLNI